MTFQPVIEPAQLRAVPTEPGRGEWSPATLLRWGRSVHDLLNEVSPERRGAALRQIQREVERWRAQQTPEQAEWERRRREVPQRGTLAAAQAIVEHLRSVSRH